MRVCPGLHKRMLNQKIASHFHMAIVDPVSSRSLASQYEHRKTPLCKQMVAARYSQKLPTSRFDEHSHSLGFLAPYQPIWYKSLASYRSTKYVPSRHIYDYF